MEEYILSDRRRIPYGLMNFDVIRRDDYYYVDKTAFIPMIEQSDCFFFFIRPHRFGKSLTVNILQHYYDINTRDKFDALFGNLYIGQHPTSERNSYLVLNLNFSDIDSNMNNKGNGLNIYCNIIFENFCKIYANYLPKDALERLHEISNAVEQLEYIYQACAHANQKIYLFIDNYDYFVNTILSDVDSLHQLDEEMHKIDYLRVFFNKIKVGTYYSIERCFITGVSPIILNELIHSFNISTDYSLSPRFNEMMGFTEHEVREMLTYYSTTIPFNHTVDELIELMKPWYDNYCFAQDCYGDTTMYNSNMVLYFVKNYIDNKGRVPRNMIESNIHIDYEKLRMLIRKDKEFEHIISVINTIESQGYIASELQDNFSITNYREIGNIVRLLYYFGLITIGGTYNGRTKFVIPNKVAQEQAMEMKVCEEICI